MFNMIPKGTFGITIKTFNFRVHIINILPKVDFLDMLKKSYFKTLIFNKISKDINIVFVYKTIFRNTI